MNNQHIQSEQDRYSRQLVIPEFGAAGQAKLKESRMLIVGAGGLGSPVLLYLAAAGVGTIAVADWDVVALSNLPRQILYCQDNIGMPKVDVVNSRLTKLNSNVKVIPFAEKICSDNVDSIVQQYDIVIDGTDNIPTRYLLNDACVRWRRPYVYGAVFQFEGFVSVLACDDGPCYRCLYPREAVTGTLPDPASSGVFGATAGTIGTIQATEAIKLIVIQKSSLVGTLLVYDALQMRFELLAVKRNQHCQSCAV